MTLTPEQIAARRQGIGGSDANKIISGDWLGLWLEKTGRKEPDDLSGVFPVQLGIVTEALNLDWYERKFDRKVTHRGKSAVWLPWPVIRCTLDGFDEAEGKVIQAKHVNAYSKIEDVRARYAPQVMHECIACGVTKGVLSVIVGTNEPVYELIEMDEFWANDYIQRCREFWKHITEDRPPPGAVDAAEGPAIPEQMRVVSMEGNNAWSVQAGTWLETVKASKKFDAAVKEIKALVEADVREASGHGIVAKRSKAGALSIKEA